MKYLAFSIAVILIISGGYPVIAADLGDGEGKVVLLNPHTAELQSYTTWEFQFTVGEHGIAQNGGLLFYSPLFWGWSVAQIEDPGSPGYTTFTASRDSSQIKAETPQPSVVIFRVTGEPLIAGDTIKIIYGDTSAGKQPEGAARADKFAEREQEFHFRVDGNGDGSFIALSTCPTVDILPGAAVKLHVVLPSTATKGDTVIARVSLLDAMNNLASSSESVVQLETVGSGLELTHSEVTIGKSDNGTIAVSLKALTPGVARLKATIMALQAKAISNPLLISQTKSPKQLYWADPHGHSGYSDGTGTPEDYYRYGRDVAGLQICSLTDHDAHGLRPLSDNPSLWKKITEVTNSFNAVGSFVTFVGYEWTSWEYGHKHVLFPGDTGMIFAFNRSETQTPLLLWQALKPFGAITIPHHPAGGPVAQNWEFTDPIAQPLVEITSIHGNSEYYDCPLMIYNPKQGAFVNDVLARGYTLGLCGGGDTHNGHPGMGHKSAPIGGITGIWAEELTRASVLKAMQERRVYASTGARIILGFTLNETIPMGAILDETPKELRFSVKAIGEEYIERAQLIRNGEVLEQAFATSDQIEWTVIDKSPLEKKSYYFARIVQQDGMIAWSSPIWILKSK